MMVLAARMQRNANGNRKENGPLNIVPLAEKYGGVSEERPWREAEIRNDQFSMSR
jgi:hypothetical protein